MARRPHTLSRQCTKPGCGTWNRYEYGTRADYDDAARRYPAAEYRCHKHRVDGQELTPENTLRVVRAVARRSDRYPDLPDLFWHIDDYALVSGFMSGQGFNATAKNFPEGTVIDVPRDSAGEAQCVSRPPPPSASAAATRMRCSLCAASTSSAASAGSAGWRKRSCGA